MLSFPMANSMWRLIRRGLSVHITEIQPKNSITRLKDYICTVEKNHFVVPSFKKAVLHADRIAIKDSAGEYTYYQLFMAAKKLSSQISNICGSAASANVAYFCNNNAISPMIQWSCWISGQVVVPLVPSYPVEMLKYIMRDVEAKMILASPEHEILGEILSKYFHVPLVVVDHGFIDPHEEQVDAVQKQILVGMDNRFMLAGTLEHDFYTKSDAMILYSAASTGYPKGVVLTHKNITSQINSLINAWNFTNKDSLLLVLPLYHTHSNLNSLLCLLTVGAKVVMLEQFDSHNVWKSLLGINTALKDRVNIFIAVPSMYSFLISEYEKIFSKNSQMVEYIKNFCKSNIRVMISGSAALQDNVFNRWKEITGHNILERYGMAEVGIVMSNPYDEDTGQQIWRKPGFIGVPLPGVTARIVDDQGKVLLSCNGADYTNFWANSDNVNSNKINDEKGGCETQPVMWEIMGELEIGGNNVFKEYYNLPDLSKTSFDENFFKTGDEVAFVNGLFKILGRINTDIIITGGYKVYSAEVESVLLNHPSIQQVVVMGVPDLTWGERVVAICVLNPEKHINLKDIRSFCAQILPTYKHPSILKIVKEIPKNSLLKIDKERLSALFFAEKSISCQK